MLDEIVLHHPLYLPAVDGVEGVACLAEAHVLRNILAVQHLKHPAHEELAAEKITEIFDIGFKGFITLLTPFLHDLDIAADKLECC